MKVFIHGHEKSEIWTQIKLFGTLSSGNVDDHWDCGEDWEENDNAQRIHKDKAAASKMRDFHTV